VLTGDLGLSATGLRVTVPLEAVWAADAIEDGDMDGRKRPRRLGGVRQIDSWRDNTTTSFLFGND
jgi:hypothetical protein